METENNYGTVWDPIQMKFVLVGNPKQYNNKSRRLVGKSTPIDLVPGLTGYVNLAGEKVEKPTRVWTYINSGKPITDPGDKYVIDGDYLYERSPEEQRDRNNSHTLTHLSLGGADRFYQEMEKWKREHPVQNFMYDLPAHAFTMAVPGAAWSSLPGWLTGAANLGFGYMGAKHLMSDDGYKKTLNFLQNGLYKNAAYSALGDVVDAALIYNPISAAVGNTVGSQTWRYGILDRFNASKDLYRYIKTKPGDIDLTPSGYYLDVKFTTGDKLFKSLIDRNKRAIVLSPKGKEYKALSYLTVDPERGIRTTSNIATTVPGTRSLDLHLSTTRRDLLGHQISNNKILSWEHRKSLTENINKQPGMIYIGDSGRTLGDLAISNYQKTGDLLSTIRTIVKNPKVEGHPLSTDSAPFAASVARKPGNEVRYANAKYSEAFNDYGVYSTEIRDILNSLETPEEQVKFYNDWMTKLLKGKFPKGWRRAYVENGKAVFPQPIILKTK